MTDLSTLATSVLREYRERQAVEWAMVGKQLTDNDLVFYGTDGKPLLPKTVGNTCLD